MAARPRVIVLLLVLALLPVASVLAQEAEDAGDQPAPIAVGENAVRDADIADRLTGILRAIETFNQVGISVESGVVTLQGTVPETADVATLDRLAGRIEGVVSVENRVEASGDVAERLDPVVDRLESRARNIVQALPLVLVALLILAAFAAIGALVAKPRALYLRLAPNAFIADIYRQLVRVAFIFAGVVAALEVMGATALLGTLLGAAGIVGLAVGFGVRDTIENFVASLMLSVRQPFEPNDLVEIDGEIGHVIRLTSRATVLLSPDGNHVRMPNAAVFKSKIVNYTRNPGRRFDFLLGVDPAEDLTVALATGLAAIRELSFVVDRPEAAAWIEAVGESTVNLRFTGWIDQRVTEFSIARGEAIRVAKAALEAGGFTLPEPLYRLRVEGGPFATDKGPTEPTASKPTKVTAATLTEATDAAKADTLDRQVAAERRTTVQVNDLLSPNAPLE